MHQIKRFLIGVVGGLVAAISKILAIDIQQLGQFVSSGDFSELNELKVTIFIFTPILGLIGGVVAWATDENIRWKLLAIGCSAPALIAPWTSGNIQAAKVVWDMQPSFISVASAEPLNADAQQSSFFVGLRALFGLESPENNRYWVIVGSKRNLDDAKLYAAAINNSSPELNAFVGRRKPGNEFYPIIVGGTEAFLPIQEANELKRRAEENEIIPNDAFLSNYAGRLPRPDVD